MVLYSLAFWRKAGNVTLGFFSLSEEISPGVSVAETARATWDLISRLDETAEKAALQEQFLSALRARVRRDRVRRRRQ